MPLKIKKGIAGGMDMTPMIDVVFQLMIFFLVATRLDEAERQLQVTLPQASEAKPITARPFEFFINISRDGQYFVDGQFRSLPDLERLLADRRQQSTANRPHSRRRKCRAQIRRRRDERMHQVRPDRLPYRHRRPG